jgi:hypothetical protein
LEKIEEVDVDVIKVMFGHDVSFTGISESDNGIQGADRRFRATTRVSQLVSDAAVPSLTYMTTHQNHAFMELLSAWRRREDARSSGTLADLAAARTSLDHARSNVHSALSSQLR